MKLSYIDAIRGIAILMVMMVHTAGYGNNQLPDLLGAFVLFGKNGVQLFFLASAFTLFYTGVRRNEAQNLLVRDFWLRRFFRIAPMYYLAIIYYHWQDGGAGISYWTGEAHHINSTAVVSNFFFFHGLMPEWINSVVPGGWSIAVEMMFYLLFPLLFKYIDNLNKAVNFAIGSIVFALMLKVVFYKFPLIHDIRLWKDYLALYLPGQLPVFSLGIIAYYIIIEKQTKIKRAAIFGIGLLAITQCIYGFIISAPVMVGLAFMIFVIALSKTRYLFFVNRLTIFFGKISYSAYLLHFAVLYWIDQAGYSNLLNNHGNWLGTTNYFLRFGIVFLVTACLAYSFYKLVEVPFQQLGKSLLQSLKPYKFKRYSASFKVASKHRA
jgi:peptidoglycan/LPS O-acetylase OafA/YrhL